MMPLLCQPSLEGSVHSINMMKLMDDCVI
uniref:Uncharacterized protein n=1 Tax=Rhizophora mucronata TaxID=61149 RepID=A0A2P2QNU3_RHIMU